MQVLCGTADIAPACVRSIDFNSSIHAQAKRKNSFLLQRITKI